MRYINKIARLLVKSISLLLLAGVLLVVATSISPIYNFSEPQPFKGKDIYNPYRYVDSTRQWQRAAFHVHTRVEGPLNECEYWPEEVIEEYNRYNYDIVTFSNHNEITTHPEPSLQVNLYEHGYNILKFHKLAFGAEKVWHFDHLLPILASQKQMQLDILARQCDILQINHPLRTWALGSEQLSKLGGYHIMELDSGHSTENEYWDAALSAGHYSYGMANDDLHYPDRSRAIAVRCNMVASPSPYYEDIRQTILDGGFYAMRLPDYGDGDFTIKEQRNKDIPYIESIGLRGDTIYISLSEQADSIKFIGAGHTTLAKQPSSDIAEYRLREEDSYARIIAYMEGGEVIYTNPFARYDSTASDTPFREPTHDVNILLTIIYNLVLLLLSAGVVTLIYKVVKR